MRQNTENGIRVNAGRLSRLAIPLFILMTATKLLGQQNSDEPSLSVTTSVGYTTFGLQDVRDFYSSLLDVYKGSGLNIPTQRDYPGHVIVGAGIMHHIPRVASFGFGARYTAAKAISSYDDFAGSANQKSTISLFSVEGIIQRDLFSIGSLKAFVGVRGGIAFIKSKFSQDIIFYDFPSENANILLTGSGKTYTAEGTLGVKKQVGQFLLGIDAGYRLANAPSLSKSNFTVNGVNQASGKLELEHNMSGFIIGAHMDFRIR